jgi:very-short-patch-repair endonuclease
MRLWQKLRNHQLGVGFRRQHPIGNFILDFYAPSVQLGIELDGGQHSGREEIIRDGTRTRWLAERGVTMLRFWNSDVTEHLSGVVDAVSLKIADLYASGVTPTRRWRADLPLAGGGNKPKV